MPEPAAQPRSRVTLGLCALLLLTAAVVFTVSGDAPHILVLTVLGLGISMVRRTPLPRTTRTFVYAGTTVAIVTTLADQFFPVDPLRFFLLPAELYAPAILFIGVTATYFDQRETNLAAIVAMALLSTMLAGNTVNPSLQNPRLPLASGLMANFHTFYALAVAAEILILVPLLPRIGPRLRVGALASRYRWLRWGVTFACLALLAVSVVGMRRAAFVYERVMQQLFVDVFQRYMMRSSSRYVFGQTVNLWRTVPYRAAGEKAVILRARSAEAPGYLRGRAYTRYANGNWGGTMVGQELPATQPGGRYAFAIFRRTADSAADPRRPDRRDPIDIYTGSDLVSDVLLTPGSANEFEIIASRLREDRNGTLIPTDWDSATGYSLRRPHTAFAPAFAGPAESQLSGSEYLDVPEAIRPPLEAVAADAFRGLPANAGSGARIAALQDFFRTHFEYELGVRMQGKTDPVVQFLLHHRRGHCELFAAATVLLLRSQQIPARYVTGFVCAERHPDRTHWVARLADAHAWAEAFNRDEGRWVLVECTPGGGLPPEESRFNALTARLDRLALYWRMLMTRVKRGYVAEAIVGAVQGVGLALLWLVSQPLRAVGVAMLLLCLLIFGLRRRAAVRAAQDAGLAPARRDLRRSLRLLERHLRRHRLVRAPATTVREFAEQIRQATHLPRAPDVASWLAEYEDLRFRPDLPTPAEIADLDSRLHRLLAARPG